MQVVTEFEGADTNALMPNGDINPMKVYHRGSRLIG